MAELQECIADADLLVLAVPVGTAVRMLPMVLDKFAELKDASKTVMDVCSTKRETTFRSILSWDHMRENWKLATKGGYIHTQMKYDYKRDAGNGIMTSMTRSRSKVNTFYGQAEGEYYIGKKWSHPKKAP